MTKTLAEAIATIELANNSHSIRFESTLYADQIASPTATSYQPVIGRITEIHECSHETAVMICFSSWGLYQQMGFNIFAPDGYAYPQDVITYCDDLMAQDDAFADFCRRNNIAWTAEELLADPPKLTAFATKYNGPGDVAGYAARVKAALEA